MAARQAYLPETDEAKVNWLNNFAEKKETHGPLFGFSSASIAQTERDAEMFAYIVGVIDQNKQDSQEFTAYKNILRDGPKSEPTATFPSFEPAAPVPTIVPADIFGRVSADVAIIKNNDNYTPALGQDFGIIGAASTFDPATYKTTIKGEAFPDGVELKFSKKGADAVRFYSRLRGQAAWAVVDKALRSPYKDTRPLAVAGVPEVREYMARGMKGNSEIGQNSNIITVVFGGITGG